MAATSEHFEKNFMGAAFGYNVWGIQRGGSQKNLRRWTRGRPGFVPLCMAKLRRDFRGSTRNNGSVNLRSFGRVKDRGGAGERCFRVSRLSSNLTRRKREK